MTKWTLHLRIVRTELPGTTLEDGQNPDRPVRKPVHLGIRRGREAILAALYPRKADFIALAVRWADRGLVREAKGSFRDATSIPAVSYSGPVGAGADLSDHRSYWAAGYLAFMVTDTAFLRNPNDHEAADAQDTLDYASPAGVVDGVLAAVVAMTEDR